MLRKTLTIVIILFLAVYLGKCTFFTFEPVPADDTSTWIGESSFNQNTCLFIESAGKDPSTPYDRIPNPANIIGATGEPLSHRSLAVACPYQRIHCFAFRGVIHPRV